jgi:deoxyribose-phosphate aldolase
MKTAHPSIAKDIISRDLLIKKTDSLEHLAALIDHTLLKVGAREDDFLHLVTEAMNHRFRSVCIPGSAIEVARSKLAENSAAENHPLICTVIGFPHGNTATEAKVCEVTAGLALGAVEFDYVQNITWVRGREWNKLKTEAAGIVGAAQGKLVKVILETSFLSEEEISMSANAAAEAGVHVLKTSTGFGTRGATENDLKILSEVIDRHEKRSGLRLGLKASGGIRSLADALNFVRWGATRLGTSSGVLLLNGATNDFQKEY